ncbi:MAG TPA: preprotein translocase subunit SecA, partial [Actinophytocola sp.]
CIMLLFRAQVAEPEAAPPAPQGAPAARVAQAAARAAQAVQVQQPTPPPPAQDQIPPALRGGRPAEGDQQFTYSGPSEGGGVQSRGGQNGNGQKPGAQGGSSRRERRAAARDAQKKGKTGPRR